MPGYPCGVSRLVVPAGQPLLTVGRYTLFGEIAKGGMATVHFGRMCSLGGFSKTVAIKRMRKDIALDPEFVAMFLDEARLAARIEHPNVVATLDVVADSGEVFLVMEYVKGETLARLARATEARGLTVPVSVAASVICGALNGLHAAHEAVGESGQPLGIVHRDVSPQNVLVGEDGVTRITDFGIAKAETRLQVTQDGQMKGKLGYMAPEQLGHGGARIDRRVDLFTAAIVFWEMLAGRRLFLAETPAETIGNILTGASPPLRGIRDDVPEELDRIIAGALSRDASLRPATADAFAIAIEEAVDHRMASPRVVGNWVMSLAGTTLESRNRYVREIESLASMQTPGAAASRQPDPSQPAAPDHPASHPHQEQQVPTGAPRPQAQPRAATSSQPRAAMPSVPRGLPAPPRYPGSLPSASPQPAPEFLQPAEPQPAAAPIVVPPPSPNIVASPVIPVGNSAVPIELAPAAPPAQAAAVLPAALATPEPVPASPAIEPISVVSSHDVSSGNFCASGLGQEPITSGNPLELEARQDSLMPPARGVSRAVLIGGGAALGVVAAIAIIIALSSGSGSPAVSSTPATPSATSAAATQEPVRSAAPTASDSPPALAASSGAPEPSDSAPAAGTASSKAASKGQPNLIPLPPPTKKPPTYLPERP